MAWNEETKTFDSVETSREDEELSLKYEKRIKHNASYEEFDEVSSNHFNRSILALESTRESSCGGNWQEYDGAKVIRKKENLMPDD